VGECGRDRTPPHRRDLHDGATERLVAVTMGLGRAQAKFERDPAGALELINEAKATPCRPLLSCVIWPGEYIRRVLADRGLDAAISSLAAKSPCQWKLR